MDTSPKLSDQYSQRQFPNYFLFVSQDSWTNPPFPNNVINGITSKCKFWGEKTPKHRPKLLESSSGATLWSWNISHSWILGNNTDRSCWEAGEENFPVKNPPQTPQKREKVGTAAAQGNFLDLYSTQKSIFLALNTLNYFVFRKTRSCHSYLFSSQKEIFYGTPPEGVWGGKFNLLVRIFLRTLQPP